MKWYGRGLFECNIVAFPLSVWGKPRQISLRMVGVANEIQSGHLQNTWRKSFPWRWRQHVQPKSRHTSAILQTPKVASIVRRPTLDPKPDADSFRKTDIIILCNQVETCPNMKQVVEFGQESTLRTSPTILHPLSSKNINTATSQFKSLNLRNYGALRNRTGTHCKRR